MTPKYALISSCYKKNQYYIVESKELKFLNEKNVLQTLYNLNIGDKNLVIRKIGLHLNNVSILDLDGNFNIYTKFIILIITSITCIFIFR